MSEKQTYRPGPKHETHVEIRRARLNRTVTALGTFILGMGTIAGVDALFHHDDNAHANRPQAQSTHSAEVSAKTAANIAMVEDSVGANGTIYGLLETDYKGISPSKIPELVNRVEGINHITNDAVVQPDQELKLPAEVDGHKADVNATSK